jgi:hypothetical protein
VSGGTATSRTPLFRAALAALAFTAALAPWAPAQDAPKDSTGQDGRRKQEIIFAELPARGVVDAPFTLAAKATSGLSVAFEVVSGPAVLDGKTLKLTKAPGLVIVRATQEGNAAFLPAAPAERAFAVNDKPAPPAIEYQPMDVRAGMGEIVNLSVQATGEPKPSLQWRKDGSPISGATGSRFTIPSAVQDDAGTYDVVASNTMGSATSRLARVTIGKRSQMISFQGPTNVMSGQAIMLSASASSGLPVRFDIVSGIGVVNGSTLTSAQGGTVVVQASQSGDSTYDAAPQVTETFLVTPSLNAQHVP